MTVVMPQIGMSMLAGTISTWCKNEGDTVEKDEVICEFETEKFTKELEAPAAGVLHIIAQEGDEVECGEPVAEIN